MYWKVISCSIELPGKFVCRTCLTFIDFNFLEPEALRGLSDFFLNELSKYSSSGGAHSFSKLQVKFWTLKLILKMNGIFRLYLTWTHVPGKRILHARSLDWIRKKCQQTLIAYGYKIHVKHKIQELDFSQTTCFVCNIIESWSVSLFPLVSHELWNRNSALGQASLFHASPILYYYEKKGVAGSHLEMRRKIMTEIRIWHTVPPHPRFRICWPFSFSQSVSVSVFLILIEHKMIRCHAMAIYCWENTSISNDSFLIPISSTASHQKTRTIHMISLLPSTEHTNNTYHEKNPGFCRSNIS